MCSIHTIDTPVARICLIVSTSSQHLGLREPAGDLVEQQQPRLSGQRTGQLEPFAVEQCERTGDDVGLAEHARLFERSDRRLVAVALGAAGGAERRPDQRVLEHGEALERVAGSARSGPCRDGSARAPAAW